MKETFLLLLLAFLLNKNPCVAQYQQFPDSNAYWTVSFTGYQCSCCRDYTYSFDNDTVINAQVYHKIKRHGVTHPTNVVGGCIQSVSYCCFDEYVCAIRNDHGNKKTYIVPHDSSSEFLLYDFNLQVGDTVNTWLYSVQFTDCLQDFRVVASIDTIVLGNVMLRQWHLATPSLALVMHSIIEGIGASVGPFDEPVCTFEAGGSLVCFNSASLQYPDTNFCGILSVPSVDAGEKVLVYPNPLVSGNVLNLFFIAASPKAVLNIYELSGRKVYSSDITSSAQSQQISLPRLAQGIYQCVVDYGFGIAHQKLLIAE